MSETPEIAMEGVLCFYCNELLEELDAEGYPEPCLKCEDED